MIGLGFHMLPLLQEFGLPLASAVLVIALQGPCQVLARGVLFVFGRFADIRPIGMVAVALQPLALLLLALAPPSLPVLLLFMVLFGAGSGLMTILRVSGVAEILGREGFGEISGAITTAAVLPRTAAPLALALMWQSGGGYDAVPWVLLVVTTIGAAAFYVAAAQK
jgi:MFS family permease